MSNIIPIEYDGHPIRFNDEGWINATDVAAKFGKEPNDWISQFETLEYLCTLSKRLFSNSGSERELNEISKLEIRKSSTRVKILRLAKNTGLIKTRAGANGGTWLHPKLAVRFARWLSIDFEIWCDEQIDALIRGTQPTFTDQRINAIFLLDKPVTWEKRFQQPFYQALSRMSGLPYNGHVGGTPSLFGMITSKWVYQVVLPDSVYAEAKETAKGSGDKIHQYLKPEAQKLVQEQLKAVTILANGCVDYKDFEARCAQSFGKSGEQGLLILPVEREFSYSTIRC
ncbi:KilA-N domain-containing protein [Xenorhabdus bovienii]|uniref:KilA-N domain-containing protein n=1 Tax=Xenorhabdus bovienii TaxID=40576 RepID=A0AAJ1JAN3_XENBV|nr:KilA-N domain-containing protein [Xenorhabdus bovienii]MDE1480119.1 KilA-N domain-containing protein [Xenorhabdus bovienii]MDE9496117.1 KilA-N domain-containing protein [Xenorhabdus bovienii]MDE9504518.1 KilA-N domain-containing protein [Xenorhabdus bovienii]MDE9511801.1 KilA-N domain-containing protein [Xenorhabdus bovienii]MDE9523443.1 KilA-N domain-containing protein [Xenorhabdus bovienii]